MRLKISLTIISLLLSVGIVSAQRQNVYFFKNSGTKVTNKDSADYIRIVSEPDSGTTLYNVRDYYKSGKRKLICKSSTIDPVTFEGSCATFYPSGGKDVFCRYEKGGQVGDVYKYYPNGKLYTQRHYSENKGPRRFDDGLILACNDSTGKPLVVDGNGHYVGYSDDFKNVTQEGELKAGLKDGKWKGNNDYKKNYITYVEEYSNGKFISGESTDADNKVVVYTQMEHEPDFKGGIQAFYEYLGRNIVYPVDARRNSVQGKVYISFVIEKDGSVVDAKILRAPNAELGEEALRVINKSPKWIPGQQLGRPVRVRYTVPVSFTLSRN